MLYRRNDLVFVSQWRDTGIVAFDTVGPLVFVRLFDGHLLHLNVREVCRATWTFAGPIPAEG